jgi:hypothetical protein
MHHWFILHLIGVNPNARPFKTNSPLPKDAVAQATNLQKPAVSQLWAGKLQKPSQLRQASQRKTQADIEQNPESDAPEAAELGNLEQALHAAADRQGEEATV